MIYSGSIDKRAYAANAKSALRVEEPTKIWNVTNVPSADEAVGFVNVEPAQGAGEAVFANRSDGSVDVYFYL